MNIFEPGAPATSPRKCRDLGRTSVLRRNAVFSFLAIVLLCVNSTIGLALDHSGTIVSDETWYPKDNPHNIVGVVTVNAGVTLTIEDGVNVLFDNQVYIHVYGTLAATGTPGTGILFSRSDTYDWNVIHIDGNGNGVFDHCTIEYVRYGASGIYVSSSGTVAVSNTTIRNCSNNGVFVNNGIVALTNVSLADGVRGISATGGVVQLTNVSVIDNSGTGFSGDGVLPTFLDENTVFDNCGTGIAISNVPGLNLTSLPPITNCGIGVQVSNCETPTLDNLVLSGNDSAFLMKNTGEFTLGAGNVIGGTGLENGRPVTIDLGSWPSASCVIPTTGNHDNDIRVISGSSDRTITWRKFADIDYVVYSNSAHTISAGGSLTIEDGVNVLFSNEANIDVNGTLTAVGTPGTGILFSRSGTYGWNGVRFLGDGSGVFDHCTIEYAGYLTSGISVYSSGTVAVSNTTIHNCSGNGIFANSGTISLLNTQIINNGGTGVYLDGATPVFGSSLAEWNDIYGNGSGQPGRNLRNGPFDIVAKYVYWGATHCADIEYCIWDQHDDAALGRVYFEPWSNATHDDDVTGVDDPDQGDVPTRFAVFPNYPNPFNGGTVIRFDLPRPTNVRLDVHNVSGARIATLVAGRLPARSHEIVWTGCNDRGQPVASGTYIYRLQAGERTETRRMMLIK